MEHEKRPFMFDDALDAFRSDASAREFIEVERPHLADDEAFVQLLKTMESQEDAMREQLSAMREQSESLRATERASARFSIASLAVAALSLAVAAIALLHDFGAIG